jgi:hypothetical protein
MGWLCGIAQTLIENQFGPIEVRCQGIDASGHVADEQPQRRRRSSKRASKPAEVATIN